MRCDLHVHSLRSGRVDLPVLRHFGRESYSEPREVYEVARRRGMDLVTITDHNTIDGALEILDLPGTFVSEEVTLDLDGGRELHLGVFDINEAQHEHISRVRKDAESLFAYLAEQKIPVCVNHLFSPLTGKREVRDFHLALRGVSHIEARNGMMWEKTNEFARQTGRATGLAPVGGSDAHTLASVAHAFTVVQGATTKEEFLSGLKLGHTIPAGGHGSYRRLTMAVATVFTGGYRENLGLAMQGDFFAALRFLALVGIAPILTVLPLVTAVVFANEKAFALRMYQNYLESVALKLKREEDSEPSEPFAGAPAAQVES